MSKIQAKPFTEKVIGSLTDELRESLLGLVNGSNQTPAFRSMINTSNYITGADKDKVQHIVLETWNKTYTGYLIYNNTYCVLIAYANNTQDLSIVNINLTNQTYTLVKEVLTILELRFILSGIAGGGSTVEALEVSNITALTDDQINELKAGDVVIKKTGNQKHSYRVSYKENNTGICLTYVDASVSETVSYDYTGGHWVYNSTDVTPLGSGGTEVEANPTVPEGTTPTDLTGLKIGNTYYDVPSGGGGSTPDSDVTVEIENNYSSTDFANRTNYATAISLQEWIANCEAGNVYTNAGIIAKVNNLISGKAFRLILIGTNHEVLAYDDTTQAKTTWQFLDMPEHSVRLGLPINVLDMGGTDSRAQLNAFLDGTNASSVTVYPTNMDGLISAQGLLQANETIYDELPETLQRHIKIVRRYYYRKRNQMTIAASTEGNPGAISNSGQMCQLAQGIFHLAGTDLGTSGQSGEGSGSKYNYFAGNANRVRYYNGTAAGWWNASPITSYTYNWYIINIIGHYDNSSTSDGNGVAPAFCI